MTNSSSLSVIRRAIAIAIALSMSLAAAPKVSKKWTELAHYLMGKYITITTKSGTIERGAFAYSRTDALVLQSGAAVPRDAVVGLLMEPYPPTRKNLEELGDNLYKGYRDSLQSLGSPYPWGLVGVPVVTAYAVIAAPFAALGDLFGTRKIVREEIEILPDAQVP